MAKLAFVFSGQGAQYSGMGRDLYEHLPAARAVFAAADKIRPGISELCFEAEAEYLRQTVNAQPGIYCVSMAAAQALKAAGVEPDLVAGFSLGELTALTFAEAMSPEEGFHLVCERGRLMQEAGEANPSVMVAVLKLEAALVDQLAAAYTQVYPVNYNSPGQIVVAGEAAQIEQFKADVRAAGGRTMPLQVSGGFHSPFMATAAREFAAVLERYNIGQPQISLYANYDGLPYQEDARAMLAKQIINPVRWQRSIENMLAAGADTFIELGPGDTLIKLISKIEPQARLFHVEDVASYNTTLKGLGIC